MMIMKHGRWHHKTDAIAYIDYTLSMDVVFAILPKSDGQRIINSNACEPNTDIDFCIGYKVKNL